MRIGLVTWADTSPTGGNVYNAELAGALRELGHEVVVRRVAGDWPPGTARDHARLAAALTQPGAAVDAMVVDGIVASGAPEVLERVAGRLVVLVHMPIAAAAGAPDEWARLEARALRAASAVISPSVPAAADLRRRYGVEAVIAPPGVRPARPAVGSAPPHLISLGAVTPLKNQLTFLSALASVADRPWTASIVGSLTDPYARVVRAAADRLGRVEVTGVVTGAALEELWARTDLLVHTSVRETYGMVVAEAAAHAVPALVPAGTGAVAALRAGRAVTPAELPTALRAWLDPPDLRLAWRAEALAARTGLPTWRSAAEAVLAALRAP